MNGSKILSVVINNYNYARFVESAIRSALRQPSELTEVIVVDDGSTDESRDVISQFANRTNTVLKANGGQASAFNAGFEQATGRWTIFLDADDMLLDRCVEKLIQAVEPHASKITWSMPIIGPSGERCSGTNPVHAPAAGDLRQCLIDKGPQSFNYAPCSGNAWSRSFLERVFPMPEEPFRQGADGYLVLLSPLYGRSVLSKVPLSAYRRHGDNFLAARSQFEMRDELRRRYPVLVDILAAQLALCGVEFERGKWRFEFGDQLDQIEEVILAHIPARTPFILVDDNTLNVGSEFNKRPCRTLMEGQGGQAGAPASGAVALERLRFLQRQGVQYVVIVSDSYWWLECYDELRRYLDANAITSHHSSTVAVYQLHGMT